MPRRSPKPEGSPPHLGPSRLWRGPDGTLDRDAWALLYARHRIGDRNTLGNLATRQLAVRAWLDAHEQARTVTERQWLVQHMWEALRPIPAFYYVRSELAGQAHLAPSARRWTIMRFARSKTEEEAQARRPRLFFVKRVRAVLENYGVEPARASSFLTALDLTTAPGPGRGRKKVT